MQNVIHKIADQILIFGRIKYSDCWISENNCGIYESQICKIAVAERRKSNNEEKNHNVGSPVSGRILHNQRTGLR